MEKLAPLTGRLAQHVSRLPTLIGRHFRVGLRQWPSVLGTSLLGVGPRAILVPERRPRSCLHHCRASAESVAHPVLIPRRVVLVVVNSDASVGPVEL